MGIILGGAIFWSRPDVITLLIGALITLALALRIESKWLLGGGLAGMAVVAALTTLGQIEAAKNIAVGCFYALTVGLLAGGFELREPQEGPSTRRSLIPRRRAQQLIKDDLYKHQWVYGKGSSQGHRLPPARRHGFIIDGYSK
jgi:hypothetical protein